MDLRKYLLAFFLLFFILNSNAQIKALEIGDKCPVELLDYLKDQPGVHQKKPILIDFWATWCVPCVEALPLLDSLQLQYKDDLTILSVTSDEEKIVNEILSKVFDGNKYNIKVLTKNFFLKDYFPHNSLPHYVWIDNEGVIKAITGDKESIVSGLPLFINNKDMAVKMKTKKISYKEKVPLYGKGLIQIRDELVYQSMIARHRPDVNPRYSRGKDYISCINSPIVRLFQIAFGKFDLAYWDFNRLEIKGVYTEQDSAQLGIFTSQKLIDLWTETREQNEYTYELMMPDSSYSFDELFTIMQQDINRFFRSKGLEGHLEKRSRKVLALTVIDSVIFETAVATEENPIIYTTPKSIKISAQPVSYLLSQLSPYLETIQLPIINGTRYKGRLSLELNGNLNDLMVLNRELKNYGMKLIERDEKIDIVVITKSNNDLNKFQ